MASTEDAAFIIGGYDGGSYYVSTIAKFQDNQWTKYGDLNIPRRFHGSIRSGDQTIIIGGELENEDG